MSQNLEELQAEQKELKSQGKDEWEGVLQSHRDRDWRPGLGFLQLVGSISEANPAFLHLLDSHLSWTLNRLLEDLTHAKSQSEAWEGSGWGGANCGPAISLLSLLHPNRPPPRLEREAHSLQFTEETLGRGGKAVDGNSGVKG
jgi:hypothetical protein